jgi:Heterokaryon incompatibility protein (HET)
MDASQLWNNDLTWPRHLLHIETLTSYPWQPGHTYGGHIKPRYNAISYTWGRFALESGDQPDIVPLQIRGITWQQHLPRIDPRHFTTQELYRIIKAAACPYPDCVPVEFVWLDIACLNQAPGSKEGSAEVDRQAKIFLRANDVCIWLLNHDSNIDRLWSSTVAAAISAAKMFSGKVPSRHATSKWLSQVSSLLIQFTRDPWFSSLWTLQEAFASPGAILLSLSRSSKSALDTSKAMQKSGGIWRLPLKHWVGAWNRIKYVLCKEPLRSHPQAHKLILALDDLGFLNMARRHMHLSSVYDRTPQRFMGNPCGLLVAASKRVAKREEDRIYAIMEVFGLKLGRSAPFAMRTDFTLAELKDQLAVAILARYPIASQLIVQNRNCAPGKAWMISSTMTLPLEAHQFWAHYVNDGPVLTAVSLTAKAYQGRLWASFDGPVTQFSTWYDVVGQRSSSQVRLRLDESWESRIQTNLAFNLRDDTVAKLAFLRCRFKRLVVVFLGRLIPPQMKDNLVEQCRGCRTTYCNWSLGLLLAPDELDTTRRCFSRLGVVVWTPSRVNLTAVKGLGINPREYLRGSGRGWHQLKGGLFG